MAFSSCTRIWFRR